jgi:hypothetical protein
MQDPDVDVWMEMAGSSKQKSYDAASILVGLARLVLFSSQKFLKMKYIKLPESPRPIRQSSRDNKTPLKDP